MKRVAFLSAFLVLPLACRAEMTIVLDITGPGTANVPLGDAVAGWQFTINQPITASALGLWDEDADGLDVTHTVGLWTSGGTLLGTAAVNNASIPVASAFAGGRWLFTEIAPIILFPGTYVLGATWGNPIDGADPFIVSAPLTTSGVSYDGGRVKTNLPDSSLVFPDLGPGAGGFFGPNLAVPVPEPAAFLLLGGAALWIGLSRVRRGRI